LALISAFLLLSAYALAWTERRLYGTWMLMIAFVVLTLWAGLNIFWARNNPSPLEPTTWLVLTTVAATAVVYYLHLGIEGEGLGNSER
jgi:peptidoglycan/LPS O-acetylase OafA/YrhL